MFFLIQFDSVSAPAFITVAQLYVLPHQETHSVPITTLATETITLNDLTIGHKNVWDCTYTFYFNQLTAQVIYFKHANTYYRTYKPICKGIGHSSLNTIKPVSSNRIWGHAEFFSATQTYSPCANRDALHNDLECSAYFVDLSLTESEYMQQTYKDVSLNLHLLIDEILADG